MPCLLVPYSEVDGIEVRLRQTRPGLPEGEISIPVLTCPHPSAEKTEIEHPASADLVRVYIDLNYLFLFLPPSVCVICYTFYFFLGGSDEII